MEWIKIEDKKPPNSTLVLLGYSNHDPENNWVVAGERRHKTYWNQFQDEFSDCEIFPTHWMPLPQPPKS